MNICIIGPGQMGHQHYETYKQIPNVNVICCVHPQLKTINNLPSCHCIELALRDYDIDIIDICAPTEHHYILAAKALMAGKYTIVEKPLSIEPFQIQTLYKLAQENNTFLFACSPMIFTQTFNTIRSFKNPTFAIFTQHRQNKLNLMDHHYHLLSCLIEHYGTPSKYSIVKSKYIDNRYYITYNYNNMDIAIQLQINQPYPKDIGYLYHYKKEIKLFQTNEYQQSLHNQLQYFMYCIENKQEPQHISPNTITQTISIIKTLEESIKI